MPWLDETLDALAEAKGEAPFSWTVWSWIFFISTTIILFQHYNYEEFLDVII